MVNRVSFARGAYPGTRSINTLLTDYKAFVGVVESETYRIMEQAALITLSHILPLVPVQYGGLRQSGRAIAIRTPKGIAAQVSFGGIDAPVTPTPNAPTGIVTYAAIVNYDAEREYNTGQAFFMESGTADSKDEVDAFIKKELKKVKPKQGRRRK